MKIFTKKLASLILCMNVIFMQNLHASDENHDADERSQASVPLHLQAESSTSGVELPWYKKKKFWIGATVVAASTAVIATTWAIAKSSSCDTTPTTTVLDDEALFPAKKCYDYIYESFPSIRDKGYNLASTIYNMGRSLARVESTGASDWICKYFIDKRYQSEFNAACCYNPRINFLRNQLESFTVEMLNQKWVNCTALVTDKIGVLLSFACTGNN
jgi:hypothetical protein